MSLSLKDFFLRRWKHVTDRWEDAYEEVQRPNWDEYFMSMAMLVATRSQDAQWQAGCVLVKDKRIIGSGYNSFPRGMMDSFLPNTRPLKYDWVIHSEANALYNCPTDPTGATCYTNGHPCLECMKALYQAGVKDYVVTQGKANLLGQYSEEKMAVYDHVIAWGKINIREIEITDLALRRALEILNKSN